MRVRLTMKTWAKKNQNVSFLNGLIVSNFDQSIIYMFSLTILYVGCCIYKKQLEFGESSSEEDEDECDHCFGHVEKKKKNRKGKDGDDGDTHDDDGENGSQENHPDGKMCDS